MHRILLVSLLCWLPYITQCTSLSDTLRYYEFLHTGDINHHVVRRDLSSQGHSRTLDFNFSGKKYHVNLKQRNDILTSDFQAVSIDSEGNEYVIPFDKLQYYKGDVEEDEDSLVIAHIQDGMITAEIISKDETIYIEPLEPHQKDKKNFMLIYRMSDVIWNLTESNTSVRMHEKNCMVPSKLDENNSQQVNDNVFDKVETHERKKRQTGEIKKNICSLVLVADYTYFTNIGQSNKLTTMNYMIQVISRVHEIYRKTDFTGIGKYIGFKVLKVIVHEEFSNDLVHRYNHQSQSGPWNVDQLLTTFSRTDWREYCLAHLFTYQDFSNGIIGLAYVASPSIYEVGGVCTRSYRDVGGQRYLNCGLSSSINWGRRLLTAEADLVTAHEIGHNFGSNHDPSNCQPNGASGNYIMYAHSVSGDKSNHNKFSSCSRYSIGQVLQNKRACFTDQKDDYCGNGIVEPGEECDSGLFNDAKKCCDDNCKFRKNPTTGKPYVCNDIHDPCCKNCEYAPKTQTCRQAIPFYCTGETKCTGDSSKCPKAPGLDGKEPCGFSRGNCQKGSCVSLCQQKNKIACSCGSGPDSCKICCKDSNSAPCVVLEGNNNEADGVTCQFSDENGRCVNGQCQRTKRDVKDEFSSLLQDFSFSKFVRFMEANIVGTILTLSLLVWIPVSCVVHYIDKKDEKEDEFMKEWMDRTNTSLVPEKMPKWKVMFQRMKPKHVKSGHHIPS